VTAGCQTAIPPRPAPQESSTPRQLTPQQAELGILKLLSDGKQAQAEFMLGIYEPFYQNQRVTFLLGCCTRSRFRTGEAARIFAAVADMGTNTVAGQCALHVLYLDRKKDTDQRFEALRDLVNRNPDDLMPRWMLAVQCRALKRNEEGIVHYGKLLEHWNPGPVLVHQTYGNLLDEVRRYEEALVHRRIAVSQEPKGWTYQGLGNTLSSLGRFKEANEAFARMVEYSPADAAYWNSWARSLRDEGRLPEAFEKFKKAAELGDSWAQNDVGYCYEKGKGVEKNDVESVSWYRLAAEQGNAYAQCNLGLCYESGRGVSKDLLEARKWYRRGADQGYPASQYNLARCYYHARGVAKDRAEAANWYRKAAEQGHAQAANYLGNCYYEGQGVKKDLAEAFKWYRKGAELGDTEAQYNLACCYDNGTGIERDSQASYGWCILATEGGSKDGPAGLKELEAKLTPLQIQAAREWVEQWKRTRPSSSPSKP
jgi:TPR repeat protein